MSARVRRICIPMKNPMAPQNMSTAGKRSRKTDRPERGGEGSFSNIMFEMYGEVKRPTRNRSPDLFGFAQRMQIVQKLDRSSP